TALGLSMDSAAKLGMMMIPIGEFSLIIAVTAGAFMRNASEIISIAFMLTIVSTLISPFLYDRSKNVADFLSRIYPVKLRKSVGTLAKELGSLESVYQNPALQNEFSTALKSFVVNIVVALAIVYMSLLASFDIDLRILPFIPKELSVNVLILPLIIWPVYKATNDLRFIAYSAVSSWSRKNFPYWRRHHESGLTASDMITSVVLVMLGVLSSIVFYVSLTNLLLVPVLFTLLALMYLSKSIYLLFEQAEDLEGLTATTGASNRDALALNRELGVHSKKLAALTEEREKAMREIRAAIKAGRLGRARLEMQKFKKRERALVDSLSGIEKKLGRVTLDDLESLELEDAAALSRLEKQETHTKKALEHYFHKQPPNLTHKKKR
ncbi:MAG: hypothetical protein V1811_03155, partial [Candidatus Micrarchaeota archaeon]